jgi:alpha-glucosidase
VIGLGRDPQRTPMQWDATESAGFSTADAWLPISAEAGSTNVESERRDSRSMLNFYRRLIEVRRSAPALSVGSYECIPALDPLFAYVRADGEKRFLVVLNFGPEPQQFQTQHLTVRGRVAVSTRRDRDDEQINSDLSLRGDEGLLIELVS